MRVILADDHPLTVAGAKLALEASRDIRVVGQACGVEELMALASKVSCDVIVVDYVMPGGKRPDGEHMVRGLRRHHPDTPIVLLTMIRNAALLSKAIDAGVAAIVDKSDGIAELSKAVRRAISGRRYLSPAIQAAMDELTRPASSNALPLSLSAKEIDIIRKFCEGKSITGIAGELHRSVATVSRQKTAGMRKLGVQNNVELIDYMRSISEVRGTPTFHNCCMEIVSDSG